LEGLEHTTDLLKEIAELKAQLYEANSVIDAIREGAVDALVVTKDGTPNVYSLETADYTYRLLIEKMGEGALSISDEGLILYCNEYFAGLLGIPANKLTGTFFNAYVQTAGDFAQLKENLLQNGISKGELLLKANDKLLSVYVSLTNLNPSVPAIGMVVTDLTQKKKHEEALARYQRQLEIKVNELNQTNTNLEQFIHVVSHDLKEPLRKIVSYTSHLSSTRADLLEVHELRNLDIVHNSATRLNSLVDDLVKYSFSANMPESDTVNLNLIIEEVKQDLELSISEREAVIHFSELPVIKGSGVQMRQLFSNLIANAIKYSRRDENPVIEISTRVTDHVYGFLPDKKFRQISLRDNGIGMEQSHLGKIFTIFQRLHMRNEYAGNGIGLAICRKIMENHFGKIDVESTPGKGSTFHLYFPV
jgi:signal transduction histidine kinase